MGGFTPFWVGPLHYLAT